MVRCVASALLVAACGQNSDRLAVSTGAPVSATLEANSAAPEIPTASTGGLWFAPDRITAGAGGILVSGRGGVARVTPSGVDTVLRAENVRGALAASSATWLAYTEVDSAHHRFRLLVGAISTDGALTPRFEVPGGVADAPGTASISAAGRYLAFLWRMSTGSNWNLGQLIVSADGGESFQLVDTPTGGAIAMSPSGSAVIVGGPGNDRIYASSNLLAEPFVDVTPEFAERQNFHDPVFVSGGFIALQRSRATVPDVVTVISSRDNGANWAASEIAGNAPMQVDPPTFQLASIDGSTVVTLWASGACKGFKTMCTNTVEVRYSTDAGKSFQTVASYVAPA